jgi:hypothetical protein
MADDGGRHGLVGAGGGDRLAGHPGGSLRTGGRSDRLGGS